MSEPIHGTIILADQTYCTPEGKWIIAGTYRRWVTTHDRYDFTQHPLVLYIRLIIWSPGLYEGRILAKDRSRDPRTDLDTVIFAFPISIQVLPQEIPVFETAFQFTGLQIQRPGEFVPLPNSVAINHLNLYLEIDGREVAMLPLEFIFVAPIIPDGENHDYRPPVPGPGSP